MIYREEDHASEVYKQNYLDGIERLIEKRQKEAEKAREKYIEDIFSDTERYREEFKAMLGWPLTEKRDTTPPEIKFTKLSEEDGYDIFRAEVDILDGLIMTGVFFKLHGDEPRPFVLVKHGGLGTPELIAGMLGDGKTGNYTDMLTRTLKYGVHVFAPQSLLWNTEKFGVPFERKDIDARLKRLGSSITALEVHGLMRIFDYFDAQDYVTTLGMLGLSYGGFYTLFTSAIDTRIKSSVSCSFFNSRDKAPWCDWVWFNSGYKFDDAEVACLIYPRRISFQMGDKDKLFDHTESTRSYEKIKNYCQKAGIGDDWVEHIVFEGKHEFYTPDDAPIERMINDLK
jgi:hypothetical protein